MPKTKIEYADFSVNPIRARHKETGAVGHTCLKISPGCQVAKQRRADKLRCLGNSCVALQSAVAFVELMRRADK